MPYHATPVENLARILAEGLIASVGPRSEALGEPEAAIYLFETADDVEAGLCWLEAAFGDEAELALLHVDVQARKEGPLAMEIVLREPVPADRLSVLSRDLFGETSIPTFEGRTPDAASGDVAGLLEI